MAELSPNDYVPYPSNPPVRQGRQPIWREYWTARLGVTNGAGGGNVGGPVSRADAWLAAVSLTASFAHCSGGSGGGYDGGDCGGGGGVLGGIRDGRQETWGGGRGGGGNRRGSRGGRGGGGGGRFSRGQQRHQANHHRDTWPPDRHDGRNERTRAEIFETALSYLTSLQTILEKRKGRVWDMPPKRYPPPPPWADDVWDETGDGRDIDGTNGRGGNDWAAAQDRMRGFHHQGAPIQIGSAHPTMAMPGGGFSSPPPPPGVDGGTFQQQPHQQIFAPPQQQQWIGPHPAATVAAAGREGWNRFEALGAFDNSSSSSEGYGDDDESDMGANEAISDEEIVFVPPSASGGGAGPPGLAAPPGLGPHSPRDKNARKAKDERGTVPIRRIMIRLLAALSDLHAARARTHGSARPPRWLDGAKDYGASFDCVQTAQLIIDEQLARLMQKEEEGKGEDPVVVSPEAVGFTTPQTIDESTKELSDDAQVILVSVEHFGSARDAYMRSAARRARHLQSILEPQWQTRDEVKARLGEERWTNNPNPKRDYAERRARDERELKELERARILLEEMEVEGLKDCVRRALIVGPENVE